MHAERVPVPRVVNFRSFLEPTLKSRIRREWALRIGLFSFLFVLNVIVIVYSGFLFLDVGLPLLCVGLLYMQGLLETPFIPVELTLGNRSVKATLYNGRSRMLRVSGRLGGFSVVDCAQVVWRSPAKSVPAYLHYGSDWVPISKEALDVIKEEGHLHGLTVSSPRAEPQLAGERATSLFKGNAVHYNVRAALGTPRPARDTTHAS